MSKLLILLSFIFCSICYGQVEVKISVKKETKRVLNSLIQANNSNINKVKIKRINRKTIKWTENDIETIIPDSSILFSRFLGLPTLDSLYSKQDFDTTRKQIKNFLNIQQVWSKNTFKNIRLVNSKAAEKMNNRNSYWEFSLPIFSTNQNFCIINYNYFCGYLCLSARTILMRKTDNGWVLHKVLYGIES